MQDDSKLKREKSQDASEERVTFDEFKKSLGSAAGKYSDEEIEKQRVVADKMADLFFDAWLMEINSGTIASNKNEHD